MHLAFRQQRVDDAAAVVHRQVTEDRNLPGRRFDFHRGEVGPEREGLPRRAEVRVRPQRLRRALRRVRPVGERRDLSPPDAPRRRARHEEPPVLEPQVLRRALQQLRRQRQRLPPHRLRVREHRRAPHRRAPAPESPDPPRALVGVPVEHPHRLVRHPQPVGRNLGPRRLVPLPVRGSPAADGHRRVFLHGDPAGLPRPEPADLHIAGEPHAQRAAPVRPAPRLFRPQRRVIPGLERQVERLLVLPAVVGEPRRRAVREPVRRNQVAPPDLRRIDPQPPGEHIHRPLDQVGRLRPPGTPVGLVRRGVRERPLRPRPRRRERVRPHDHRAGERRRRRPRPAVVGAAVVERVQVGARHPPVLPGVQRQPREQVAPVGRRQEVLAARGDPPHRPAQPPRQPADQHLLRVEVRLRPEPAADLRRDRPHLLRRDAEDLRHAVPHPVRRLGGGPDREPPLVVPRRRRAGLHRAGDQPLDAEVERHPRRRLRAAAVRAGPLVVVQRPDERPVPLGLLVERLRPRRPRRPRVPGAGQVPVVHHHRLGGVGGLFRRLRDHRRHRVAHAARPVLRERPAVGDLQVAERPGVGRLRHRERALQVGEHLPTPEDAAHPGGLPGLGGVHPQDLGVRVRAPRQRQEQRVRERDVRGVGGLPGDQRRVFAPANPLADAPGVDRHECSFLLGGLRSFRASS